MHTNLALSLRESLSAQDYMQTAIKILEDHTPNVIVIGLGACALHRALVAMPCCMHVIR